MDIAIFQQCNSWYRAPQEMIREISEAAKEAVVLVKIVHTDGIFHLLQRVAEAQNNEQGRK